MTFAMLCAPTRSPTAHVCPRAHHAPTFYMTACYPKRLKQRSSCAPAVMLAQAHYSKIKVLMLPGEPQGCSGCRGCTA